MAASKAHNAGFKKNAKLGDKKEKIWVKRKYFHHQKAFPNVTRSCQDCDVRFYTGFINIAQ